MKITENIETKEKTDKNNGTKRLSANMKKSREQNKENEMPNAKKGKRMATEKELDDLTKNMQEGEWKKVKPKRKYVKKQEVEIGRTSSSMDDSLEEREDDQTEASMEYEDDNDRNEQEKEITMITNDVNKEAIQPSQKITENREVYWNQEGILKRSDEMDKSRMESRHNKRYEKRHGGPFKVIITLTRGKSQTKRGKNSMTILKYLINEINIRPKEITMSSHTTAEVNFTNYQDANDCLDFIEKLGTEGDFTARTEARSFTCKGVITDWPDTEKELWEN